jgi:hypothetical protein
MHYPGYSCKLAVDELAQSAPAYERDLPGVLSSREFKPEGWPGLSTSGAQTGAQASPRTLKF